MMSIKCPVECPSQLALEGGAEVEGGWGGGGELTLLVEEIPVGDGRTMFPREAPLLSNPWVGAPELSSSPS
jgi:hypothetical protein